MVIEFIFCYDTVWEHLLGIFPETNTLPLALPYPALYKDSPGVALREISNAAPIRSNTH
jgi:hypothetical protein